MNVALPLSLAGTLPTSTEQPERDSCPVMRRQRVEQLYRETGLEIRAKLYAIAGCPEWAGDALHEAFVRLYQTNDWPDQPVAWLVQVGRNWLRDQQRRSERRATSLDATIAWEKPDQSVPDPMENLMADERRSAIRAALSELPEMDRQLAVLRYALGWSSQQIGARLTLSTAAVDMRLSRMRQRLAALLGGQGGGS